MTTISRRGDLSLLHPLVMPQFQRLLDRLNTGLGQQQTKVWFQPFESYRSPERQMVLYRQGRQEPGKIVTKAQPWQSPHQYGLAVDFVPRRKKDPNDLNSPYVWDWDLASDDDWAFLASCAAAEGLSCPIVWDRPHVEASDVWADFQTVIGYRARGVPLGLATND